MSRINGEKARAAIARQRRTQQRMKDRAARALMVVSGGTEAKASPAPKKPKAPKLVEAPAAEKPVSAKPRARKAGADSAAASSRSQKADEE